MKRKGFLFPLALLLVFVLLLPLYGCGGEEGDDPAEEKESGEEISLDELFGKAEDIEGYSCDYAISDETTEQVFEGKMYLKGMKKRMEMTTEEGQVIQIIDAEEKKAFSYLPEQRLAFEEDFSQLESPETPSDYVENADTLNAKYLGREDIDGINCRKYSVESEDSSVVYWVHDEYGLPVKIETTVTGIVSVMEFRNFEIGDVADDLFVLPNDVEVQNISDMMQNMPAAP